MKPKDEIYNEYVNLTVKYYLEKLKRGAAGSVIKGLTKSDMLNIPISKTNMEHFEKFHKILRPIFKKKLINRKENQSLKELRDSLLPKLMSGEIRVPLDDNAKEVN
jgi:type I restriction enzyme S subunit